MRVGNADVRQDKAGGGKGHGHAVILVGGNDRRGFGWATLAIPTKDAVLLVVQHIAQLAQLGLKGGNAVGFLYLETLQAGKAEGDVQEAASDNESLCQVGNINHIGIQMTDWSTLTRQADTGIGELGVHRDGRRGRHLDYRPDSYAQKDLLNAHKQVWEPLQKPDR